MGTKVNNFTDVSKQGMAATSGHGYWTLITHLLTTGENIKQGAVAGHI